MQIQKSLSPKSLTNEALLRTTHALVAEERKLTTEILWHLHEIQVRRLYAEKGYGSLFEYAVHALGYSEAAAGRRISAMRLLAEVPEIEPALKAGEISLSTLSTIQSFVRRKDEPISKQEKRELIFAPQGKSRRECEKHLVALDPLAAAPQEKERVVSPTQTEVRFIADDALMEKLQKIRELDGHFQTNASYLELFHRMADLALKRLDPLDKKKTSKVFTPPAEQLSPSNTTSANERTGAHQSPNLNSRYVPAHIKRQVWFRDQARCQFRNPEGKLCESRFALEIDHIVPFSQNGKTELKNLQLLCRTHNRLKALSQFGPSMMGRYLKVF